MRTAWRLPLAVVCLLVATAAVASTPTADEMSAAQALHDKGVRALAASRFNEAAQSFDAAHLLDPHPVLLWNAARAHDLAGHADEAVERYRKVIADPSSEAEHLERATARLAVLEANAKEPAADKGGSGAQDGGKVLASAGPRPTATPAPRREAEPTSARVVAGWSLVGLSIGAAVSSGAVYLASYQMASDLEQRVQGAESGVVPLSAVTHKEALSTQQRVDHTELAAIILGASAAGLAFAGTLLLLLGDDDPGDADEVDGPDADVIGFTPTPVPGGAVGVFQGRF